ncbi:MAG: alpha/beta hydrolase [Pseudomonadota bacterium]
MLKRLSLLLVVGVFAAAMISYLAAGWGLEPLDDQARAKAPGAFLETSQGKIHYQWYGDEGAPIVVMAHGLAIPSFVFEQNAQALAEAGFRVLTFDHLGRGWSDRPDATYDDSFYQREMLELMDGLRLQEPVGLVGQSMGGLIASDFAANHSERIQSLFLLVPSGLDVRAEGNSLSSRLIKTPVLGDWIMRVFGRRVILGQPQFQNQAPNPQNRLQGDMAEQLRYEGFLDAILSTYRNIDFQDREEVYQKLDGTDIPVAAVFGSADPTVLPSSLAKLKGFVPRAETTMIERGTHGLNYENSSQVNRVLVEFFQAQLGRE